MFKSTSTSLILIGILAVVVGIFAIAWPGVGVLTLALLFGLYALIYGFSQITAGIQLRQLPADVDSLAELHDAAT